MTDLVLVGPHVPLVLGSLFLTRWSRLNSASTAVVAHSNIFSYIHSFLVHVVNLCSVYVPHRGVIEEVPSLPSPTKRKKNPPKTTNTLTRNHNSNPLLSAFIPPIIVKPFIRSNPRHPRSTP